MNKYFSRSNFIKNKFVFFVFFQAYSALAEPENYYVDAHKCPAGTAAVETKIGEVDPELLFSHATNQAGTSTCSFHAGMVLVNALRKQTIKGETKGKSSDLDVLDAILNTEMCGRKPSSIDVKTGITQFLLNYSKRLKGQLNEDSKTVSEWNILNKNLLNFRQEFKSCDKNLQSACLQATCEGDRLPQGSIENWSEIASAIIKGNEPPVKILSKHIPAPQVEIPPYLIKSWSHFSGDTAESKMKGLQKTILNHFIEGKDHLLPLGLNTCFKGDTENADCPDEFYHSVAATKITEVKCLYEGEEVAHFHKIWIANSWGKKDGAQAGVEGPYDLGKMIEGIVKVGSGVVSIQPRPKGYKGRTLVNHPEGDLLFEYTKAGDFEGIKELINEGKTQVNKILPNGHTALFLAAQLGDLNSVQTLIHLSADVNATDSQNATPLFIAAQMGNDEAVKTLIKAGAKPDFAIKNGTTPLLIATSKGHSEVIKALLDAKVNPNQVGADGATPLFIAAEAGNEEAVITLVKKGARTDLAIPGGATPLHIAAQKGYTPILRTLAYEGKADPKLRLSDGSTPLFLAAMSGHESAVKELLPFGNVNQSGPDSWTPLTIAAAKGHLDVVQSLIDSKKANLEKPGAHNATALELAVSQGHLEVVKALLSAGATLTSTAEDLADESPKSEELFQLFDAFESEASAIH